MRSLSVVFLLSVFALIVPTAALAHGVTVSGTTTFAALDGSSSDHDGTVNGVFTVSDGDLVIAGIVNCNDDTGASDSACAMAFAVSGNMSVTSGGALYAENRSGSGNGGAITLTVGGNLALSGDAVISTASRSSSGSTGGAITANVTGSVSLASGTTIDAGSANAQGGAIAIAAGGTVTVDGNVLSGPSRTLLSTRLSGGAALDGGSGNSVGGAISIGSSTFAEPAVTIGSNANIISQGADSGAGPVTIEGCGITVKGLVAALSRKDGVARVTLRSGKDVLVDGRDLGGSGTRMGRVRADAPSGTALNKGVDVFAAETVDIHGPASGLFTVTALPGLHDSKSYGGLIRIISLGDAVNGSGNMIDDGHSASGDSGGTVEISAKEDITLNTAVIRAVGDFNTNNANRGGGTIHIRSYSGDVIWTNGTGEVRPLGSTSNLPLADQGSIVLTACGTVDTTGSTFPVMGVATSTHPQIQTGVCSPAAPSLPAGAAALITCNTPPVAVDGTASTNEDTTVTITLSGTDADGDSLTFSIVAGPFNGVLGPIVPTGPTSATVDYTPNANYNGGDSFVFQANDGNGGTDNGTVTITIAPVNDPPSFLAGPSVTALEDSGTTTYPNWATSISAGPADESGQTVSFTVTNDNNALFTVQPAVDASGTLTFTLAANSSGSATLTVVAQDNGGTANGGVDTSAPQTSTINVTAVNDEPSFTSGGDVTVNEDSGSYSAAWATSISAGANESGQTLTFSVSNDNTALFSAQPAISPAGVLTFTTAADANGSATVTVTLSDDGGTANGGDDTSAPQTFLLTVNAVNDAPSFTSGGNVSVLEDSGAYSAAWATGISTGPANESGQTVLFSVSNDNAALFASQPAIDPSGNLTFTVAANSSGSATVTVTLSDDGGTANGGVDTSGPQTFTITVGAVNDAPSFTSGGNVSVNEDSGAYSATWATAISAGPNESGQVVTFFASNDNTALFSAQPSIDSAGVLTFTPAANAYGSATVSVYAQDDGGTANGGADTSATVTFVITVNGVNDPPTAANDAWETEGNTELRVDHGAALTPYVGDTTPSGKGVLDNDADNVEGDPVVITGVVGCSDTIAPFVCAVTGGTLTLEANGTFTFQPSAGATSASFQYTLADQPSAGVPASATGSVTITIHDMIWYVNGSAAPGGDGTSALPFRTFASLDGSGDVDGPGDYIFVHNSAVASTIALEAQQKLWGEGIGLIIPRNLNGNGSPTTLVAPGVRPTIASVVDTVTITAVTGVEVAGLTISSSGGNGIDVSSPAFSGSASASIYSNAIAAAGAEGIDVTSFNSGTTTVNINTTDIVSTGNGVNVTGGMGTVVFSYSNGTITSTAGQGIFADGASLDALIVTGLANVTVSGTTAGNGVTLLYARFDANPGTAAFDLVSAGSLTVGTSADPVGGRAVVITNASGDLAFGTLSAHGTTDGVTIAGSGLFSGAAGMRVASSGGTLSAGAGTGLNVSNASIAAAGLSFTSISATGGTNGINLNNTGSDGGLTVSGAGTAGSGGTIQNTTGYGISLTDTRSPSFSRMNVSNTGRSGIFGTGVVNFALTDSAISGSGSTANAGDSNIDFDLTGVGAENNLSGVVTITGNTLTNAPFHGIDIFNRAGTISNATITGNTITSSTSTATSMGSGIRIIAFGTAASVAQVTKADVSGNQITNFPGGVGLQFQCGQASAGGPGTQCGTPASATDVIKINGNTVQGASAANRIGGEGILVVVNGIGAGNFEINNNTVTFTSGTMISHSVFGNATVTTVIDNNVVTSNSVSGAQGIGVGTSFTFGTTDTPSLTATISNNQVSQTNGNGILAVARDAIGTLRLKVLTNSVGAPTASVRQGIRVDSGNSAGNNNVCLNIAGNSSAGSGGATGIGLRKQGTNAAVNVFSVNGMAATSTPGVETYVNGLNPSGGGTTLLSATSGFTNCSNP